MKTPIQTQVPESSLPHSKHERFRSACRKKREHRLQRRKMRQALHQNFSFDVSENVPDDQAI